ncbi:MAG: YraN family protein [Balneolaceae bacterium]
MAKKSKRTIGNEAEDLACNYLYSKGWEILDRNYYAGHAEVDIIAKDENVIVFIEVKMRSSTFFGSPIEHIDELKVRRIFEAAERWTHENDELTSPLRFDVIGILSKKSGPEITHITDAFR